MKNKNYFMAKLAKILQNPSLVTKSLKNRFVHMYRYYVQKDEFAIAIRKWFKDKGDESLRLNYALCENSVVVDVGGYKGEFAESIYRKFGCSIYLFEPVNRFYLESVQRFVGNEKVKCFNYGLSDSNKSLYISNENDGSSLIRDNDCQNREMVTVKRFDEVVKSLRINRIDLLKINIEGAEFLLLPHILMDKNIITNIANIQIQFHDFYPNAKNLRDEIRAKLSETHNEEWSYPFVWESWIVKPKEICVLQS